MNRIQLLDCQTTHASRPTASPRYRKRPHARPSSPQQQSFFVPMHYEPNYAYPLVVWLHGPCDGHPQLRTVMPHISVRNYVAVAPACREAQGLRSEYAEHPWQQDEAGIVSAMERVESAIEQAAARFHIARHRVFLAGIDEGGTMALRLGMAAPGLFAGVASFGGPFPQGSQPLANLSQARQLPMLIGHGRDSEIYSIERICDELRLCHVAGLSLNLRQYPCGHELTTQMLSDLNAWMMEIVTGVVDGSTATDYDRRPSDELN